MLHFSQRDVACNIYFPPCDVHELCGDDEWTQNIFNTTRLVANSGATV